MEDGVSIILEAVRRYGPEVRAYKELGTINVTRHSDGDLLIFNYGVKATFEGRWNTVERASRGLIVHWPTGTVAARPFEKFFNLNEANAPELPPGPFEVTAKMDGSLGVLYRRPAGYTIATRGSFVSKQAGWATSYLRKHHDLSGLDPDVTLLFEIIYPENKVIVNYGETRGLYLIGARRFDGYDFSYRELSELAGRFKLPVVPSVEVSSLEDLVKLAHATNGVEGWVVRFGDGSRVKVKTVEYITFARLLVGLTPNRVRETLLGNQADWDSFMMSLPEELYRQVSEMAAIINGAVAAEEARLLALFESVAPLAATSRKDFAQVVRTQHLRDSPYLFVLLDGKPIRPLILRQLDLAILKFPENSAVAALQEG